MMESHFLERHGFQEGCFLGPLTFGDSGPGLSSSGSYTSKPKKLFCQHDVGMQRSCGGIFLGEHETPMSGRLPPFRLLLRTLSQSEKHLATLARCLGSSLGSQAPLALDEFTSGLDRSLAKRVCAGLCSYFSKQLLLPPVT